MRKDKLKDRSNQSSHKKEQIPSSRSKYTPTPVNTMWGMASTIMRPTIPDWLEVVGQRLVDNDPALTTLEITHQRIDDSMAIYLAQALEENHTVTVFILSLHSIVDDGALAIATMLGNNKTIDTLQFRDLRNSREANLLFAAVGPRVTITEFSLRHSYLCRTSALSLSNMIEHHASICEVRLVDCQMARDGLAVLADGLSKNTVLTRLYLVNNELGAGGALAIGSMLSKNKSLQEVYVCENDIGDAGTKALCEGLRENTIVRLLDLRSNYIGKVGAASITSLLNVNKSIERLLLGNNDLGDPGVSSICASLATNTVVRTLDLSNNDVSAHGTEEIAAMLRTNDVLQALNLAFNSIGDDGTALIANVLETNKALRRLSLTRNKISSNGVKVFAKSLPSMRGLKELTMIKNSVDQDGALALLKGLEFNMELEYLQVEDTFLSPEILKKMVHWIKLNCAGRKIFRETNLDHGLWAHVLAKPLVNSDHNVLFHFLSEKPEVFQQQRKRKLKILDENGGDDC
jgi:Ran GTPase-activating protein (RanGAP) involved in mRNA processing and transport